MSTVISVENLSKAYRLGQIGTGTFTYDLALWWAKLRGEPNPLLRIGETDHGNRQGETLWALKGVSFTVEQGEVLGIIGRNGAGKSTLLKILSRVTAPTSGRIKIKGRVASLLEVGTGFHPELTGRENIYLNSAILGMSRRELDRKFDEIVDFAGVEKFIETPVKRYSSGMYVRLAFAVAAHLEPEILVVDEVLAVGDAEFQKKCLGKMGKVAKHGRTVLFVSHNMGAIRSLCSRCLLLQNGNLLLNDETSIVVDNYLSNSIGENSGEITWAHNSGPGSDCIVLKAVRLLNHKREISNSFDANQPLIVELEYEIHKELRGFRFHITFITIEGEVAFRTTDHNQRVGTLQPGKYVARCIVPPHVFNQRKYSVAIGCGVPRVRVHIDPISVLSFTVEGGLHGSFYPEAWPGVVAPKTEWEVDIPLNQIVD